MPYCNAQDDQAYMHIALEHARIADRCGEVPVGAVVVSKGRIIATSHNQTIALQDPCAHAEILALRQAAANMNNHRLIDVCLYVTLEPCLMCLGALIQARIKRLIYAAHDRRCGLLSLDKGQDILSHTNHKFEVTAGVLHQEASKLLTHFFKAKR